MKEVLISEAPIALYQLLKFESMVNSGGEAKFVISEGQVIVNGEVEIKTNFIRPVTAKTGVLRCEARPIHIGKRLATVEGYLRDGKGRLVAHGTSTCSIFKVGIA
ncbi:MAG: RNA-binding S4 domain-containing protein [Deltaproteobacteria bacterium]|nr:RNA-binding S4 domain-containing protein [Deltaproteobacteria bacterium]MBW2678996.1 RNA-binding S4 domain-containing protein [Deltaproteobacteria bacterium]